MVLLVKKLPANAGDSRDVGLIPGLGRSPGGGNGNSLLYSCLENSMDRGVWWATVSRVTKESNTTVHTHTHTTNNLRRCMKQRHPTIPGNSVLLTSNYRPALLSKNFNFLAQLTDFLPSFTSTLIK